MRDLVKVLVYASEKAANIARLIRHEEELFKLLIEEKEWKKRNDTFVPDFKTLADVLIQETVRNDVCCSFPEIEIFGEESNLFTNGAGESVKITVKGNLEETQESLQRVLFQNARAADMLSKEVYSPAVLPGNVIDDIIQLPTNVIETSQLGIWIDPIDATSEYIKGQVQTADDDTEDRIRTKGGLSCATVLIGVYSLETGISMIGVINQPFWKFTPETERWTGRVFWGVSAAEFRANNLGNFLLPPKSVPRVIIISDNEEERIKNLLSSQFQITQAPGAGYKLLCVVTGLADFYVLSKNSTYSWDTCAPHAILKSLGGGVDSFEGHLRNIPNSLGTYEITYKRDDASIQKNFSNTGGLIAFRGDERIEALTELLRA